jgi:hypothetical protein
VLQLSLIVDQKQLENLLYEGMTLAREEEMGAVHF